MNTLFVRPRDPEARALLLAAAEPTRADPNRGAEAPGGFVWYRRYHEGTPRGGGFDESFGAAELSREYGEAIYLFRGDGELSASFVYEHAKEGALVRRLAFHPCEPSGELDVDRWRAADGEPEPWEASALRAIVSLGEEEPRPRTAEYAIATHFDLPLRRAPAGG